MSFDKTRTTVPSLRKRPPLIRRSSALGVWKLHGARWLTNKTGLTALTAGTMERAGAHVDRKADRAVSHEVVKGRMVPKDGP
jgi:hypothetical protein